MPFEAFLVENRHSFVASSCYSSSVVAALAVGEGHQVQLPKVMAGAGDAVHVWDTVMAVVPQATVEDVYDLEATILSVVVPANENSYL